MYFRFISTSTHFFDRGITPFDRTTSQKHCTVVPRLSEASPAVPRPSKIAGKGGKFKILQSALCQEMHFRLIGRKKFSTQAEWAYSYLIKAGTWKIHWIFKSKRVKDVHTFVCIQHSTLCKILNFPPWPAIFDGPGTAGEASDNQGTIVQCLC